MKSLFSLFLTLLTVLSFAQTPRTLPPDFLPKATATTLGAVKIGAGLSVDANGVLSVTASTTGNTTPTNTTPTSTTAPIPTASQVGAFTKTETQQAIRDSLGTITFNNAHFSVTGTAKNTYVSLANPTTSTSTSTATQQPVDQSLSSTSTNAVGNKTVTDALAQKSSIGHTHAATDLTGFAGAVQIAMSSYLKSLPGYSSTGIVQLLSNAGNLTWGTPSSSSGTTTPATSQLATPTPLTLTATSSNNISSAWPAIANATGYNLQRGLLADYSDAVTVYSGTATSLPGSATLNSGTTYYYRVQATSTNASYTSSNYANGSATTMAATAANYLPNFAAATITDNLSNPGSPPTNSNGIYSSTSSTNGGDANPTVKFLADGAIGVQYATSRDVYVGVSSSVPSSYGVSTGFYISASGVVSPIDYSGVSGTVLPTQPVTGDYLVERHKGNVFTIEKTSDGGNTYTVLYTHSVSGSFTTYPKVKFGLAPNSKLGYIQLTGGSAYVAP